MQTVQSLFRLYRPEGQWIRLADPLIVLPCTLEKKDPLALSTPEL